MTTWTGFNPGETWIPTMGTATGYWVTTSLPTVAFTGTTYSYTHLWSQWSSQTWGYIQSSGLKWEQMAGLTFITPATTNPTVWT